MTDITDYSPDHLKALVPCGRAHRAIYTDPVLFDLEMERIFESSWIFVAHESEIPGPGDYKTTYVGRQPVIVVRSKTGEVGVLINRCMHRGALVCRSDTGSTKVFRCLYHGWTYSADSGRLLGVPYPDGYASPAFDKSAMGLRVAPRVATRAGFVFASLSDAVDDLDDHLGVVGRYLDLVADSAPDGRLTVDKGCTKYSVAGNWKLQAENIMDLYHAPFTHETALGVDERSYQRPSDAYVFSFPNGHGLTLMDPRLQLDIGVSTTQAEGERPTTDGQLDLGEIFALKGTVVATGLRGHLDQTKRDYFEALEAGRGTARAGEVAAVQEGLTIFVFPNLYIQPVTQHYRVFRPVAVDQTEVQATPYALCGAPDAWERTMLMRLNGWASAMGFGQPEDVEALGRCQEGLQARSVEWLDFSRGLHRERTVDGGATVGYVDDETFMRGLHDEWLRLMSKVGY